MLTSMRTYWGKSPSCQGHHQMWGKNKSNPTQMWGRRPLCCINSPLELLMLPPRPMHTRFFTLTEQTAAEMHMQMCSCHRCKQSGLAWMQCNGGNACFRMHFMRNVWRGSQRERKWWFVVSDDGHSSPPWGCTALLGPVSLGHMNIETSCHTPFSSNAKLPGQT